MDGSGRLWIATFHEVIVLDLKKPLPRTISNRWIQLRNLMLIPAGVMNAAKWIALAPIQLFDTYSANVCGIGYLTLSGLILPAIFGMYWGNKIKNQNLLKSSRFILLIAILGAVCFWILAFLMALFTYRD